MSAETVKNRTVVTRQTHKLKTIITHWEQVAHSGDHCYDVYPSETDVFSLKRPLKLRRDDDLERGASSETSQWQRRPGPHVSRTNKSKYFTFIVMCDYASAALCKPPIGNSTRLISTLWDENELKKRKRHGPPKLWELWRHFAKR